MADQGDVPATIKCNHCKGDIPAGATRCMHCRQTVRTAKGFGDQLKLMGACAAVGLAVIVAGWVLGGSDDPTLSEAFCLDLEAGMAPAAIMRGHVDPAEQPDRAYGMASVSCPEQLRTNSALRQYLISNGIDPEA